MLVKSNESSAKSYEFPAPIDAFSLRASDGLGQKKIRLSKLLTSVVDSINLHNKSVIRSVHVFSAEASPHDAQPDKYYQHHLDYMTLLSAMTSSTGEETFCVMGGQLPTSNATLRQIKYQIISGEAPVVQEFIEKSREAIRTYQKSFASSDAFNRIIVQDAAGKFRRASFVFRSLKFALREWQKINGDDLAKQIYQKKPLAEPVVSGWGIQGFRFSRAQNKKMAKVRVYDWELAQPISLASLAQIFSDIKGFAAADGWELGEDTKFYSSCPYMAVSSVLRRDLHTVFPKAELSMQEAVFGWSPVHSMVASLTSSATSSVFLDLNMFPVIKAVVRIKDE